MASLFIISPGKTHTYELGVSTTIGSSQEADIYLELPDLESVEARIDREGSNYLLSDVTGRGLIRVDRKPVQRHLLKEGDKIELGGSFLIFTSESKRVTPPRMQEPYPQPPPLAPAPTKETQEPSYQLAEAAPVPKRARPRPCIYCGRQILKGSARCPHCGELLGEEARKKAEEEAGPWSLLTDRAMATRGVKLAVMVRWVREGRIDRNSTVRGPSTRFQWRYAAETPVLSKYLGLCPHCQSPVAEKDVFCAACKGDLDGKGRIPPEKVAQVKKKVPKRRGKKRLVLLVSLLLIVGVVAMGYTGLWRYLFPAAQERWVEEKVNAVTLRFKVVVGPEHFGREQALLKQAAGASARGDFQDAITIYEGLMATYPDTDFAAEVSVLLQRTRGWQRARRRINLADNFRRNNMHAQALLIYQELKATYPDYPLMNKLNQRIADTRRALGTENQP